MSHCGEWLAPHEGPRLYRRRSPSSGPSTIKSAAENIYPVEVERCLGADDVVAEVARHRDPRPPLGAERQGHLVAPRDAAPLATEDELVEHHRILIVSYKKPRSVEFVDELPRNGSAPYDVLDARFGGGTGGRTRSA